MRLVVFETVDPIGLGAHILAQDAFFNVPVFESNGVRAITRHRFNSPFHPSLLAVFMIKTGLHNCARLQLGELHALAPVKVPAVSHLARLLSQ